jgi:hypothetical protein
MAADAQFRQIARRLVVQLLIALAVIAITAAVWAGRGGWGRFRRSRKDVLN